MRWWIYQKERFPVIAHGILIAAFSSCAVSYSSLLTHQQMPDFTVYLVAFITCFLFFLQLRIADEFKDSEEDAQYRPYRAVPRGLVSLKELGWIFAFSCLIQLGLALWLFPKLIWVLALAWLYLLLMSVEFFARDWLKARPITYLWTHMLIMPIVDFYATACDWIPRGDKPFLGLALFLAASFTNGLIIEIGRKIRHIEDEEDGVPTYSKLWGKKRATWVWFILLFVTAVLGVLCGYQIQFTLIPLIILSLCVLVSLFAISQFFTSKASGKLIENFTGIWTILLYLSIGLVPLLLKH